MSSDSRKVKYSVATLAVLVVTVAFVGIASNAQAQEDVLIVGIQNDTVGLNPWDPGTNSVWKSFIYRQWVFETLYTGTPAGDNIPLLADPTRGDELPGIDIDPLDEGDELVWDVFLRPDLTFTDGNDLTADDVVFSYHVLTYNAVIGEGVMDIALSHDTPLFERWPGATVDLAGDAVTGESKVGVEKIDDLTIRFTLAQPYWGVLEGVLTAPIMPQHIWNERIVAITVEGNTEYDMDTTFGTEGELEATVGTGPWILESWTPFTGAELVLYDNYWGQGESLAWAGEDWPLLPANLERISIRIFGTLDVALLALSRGDVHIVPWNTGPSYYNALQTNPNIGFEIATESGFFYLAFNMRKQPMNLWEGVTGGAAEDPTEVTGQSKDRINDAFRTAVGHAIDKDFIVDRLLGGFGIKGTVPIGILNPAVVNESAVPPEFDLSAATALLNDPLGDGFNPDDLDDPVNDDAFLDRDDDGWRDLPVAKGGGPLQFSILTPPKDYDPVRADAGIMISKNLKSIGLNIDSAPTSFDTIVTQAFVTFDFDMYILGWLVGTNPEFFLRTFFGCGGGNNAPGYCNPAYDALLDDMDVEFDTQTRYQIIKDALGILVEDLPYDVLYYRQQIFAFRQDIWAGWVPDSQGEIYSFWSISRLRRPAAVELPPEELRVSLNAPGAAAAQETILAQIAVTQGGLPAPDAQATISWDFGPDIQVTTDRTGTAIVPITLPFVSGDVTFTLTVTKGDQTGGDRATVTVIPRTPIAKLTLSMEDAVIEPGATTTVVATVTDENGQPIQGVQVQVDPEVLIGSIDVTSRLTNTDGIARFEYTAPTGPVVLNRHLYDLFKASISVENTLTPEVQEAAILIGVDNDEREWNIVRVVEVENMTGIEFGEMTTVTVELRDADGDLVPGETVVASVTDGNASAFVNVTPMEQTTNAGGVAVFVFKGNVASTQETNHTALMFEHETALSIGDGVGLIAWNGSNWQAADGGHGRGAIVNYDAASVAAGSSITATVTLWNETGVAPIRQELNETGVPTGNFTGEDVFWELPFAPQGSAGHFDAGLYIWFWADVAASQTDYDAETNTSDGMTSQSITVSSFALDLQGNLRVGVGGTLFEGGFPFGLGPQPVYFLRSDFLIERARMATLASATFDKAFVTFDQPAATVTLRFEELGGPFVGEAVEGLNVQVYEGIPPPAVFSPARPDALLGDFVTDDDGEIEVTFAADRVRQNLGLGFSALFADAEFISGFFNPDFGFWEGALPHELKIPYLFVPNTVLVTASAATPVVKVGQTTSVLVRVTDIWGQPVAGATVFGGGTSSVTDADGRATLSVTVTERDINRIGITVFSGTRTGSASVGIIGGSGSFTFSNFVMPAGIVQGTSVTISVDVTNNGPVADVAVVPLTIDGTVVARKSVEVPAGATVTVNFEWTFTDTASHEVSAGGLDPATVQAAGAIPPGAIEVGTSVIFMIVLALVGLVGGFAIARFLLPGRPPEES